MATGDIERAALDLVRARRRECERQLAVRDKIDMGGAAFPPPRAPLAAELQAAQVAEIQAARAYAAVWR